MTRETIIELLKKDKKQRGECLISTALEVAIKALEQEPCDDVITIKLEVDKNEPLTDHDAHNIYEFLNQYGTVLKIGKIFEKGGSEDD